MRFLEYKLENWLEVYYKNLKYWEHEFGRFSVSRKKKI